DLDLPGAVAARQVRPQHGRPGGRRHRIDRIGRLHHLGPARPFAALLEVPGALVRAGPRVGPAAGRGDRPRRAPHPLRRRPWLRHPGRPGGRRGRRTRRQPLLSQPWRCHPDHPQDARRIGRVKVLHVAAEIFPLVKTGGLGDVVAALPPVLAERGLAVRLLLPGLRAIRDGVRAQKKIAEFGPAFGAASVTIRHGRMPETGVQAYVIDAPWLYAREGNPYVGPDGLPWPDNAQRFAMPGRPAAHRAFGEFDPFWAPDILHAHGWHAALSLADLAGHPAHSVPTVHIGH